MCACNQVQIKTIAADNNKNELVGAVLARLPPQGKPLLRQAKRFICAAGPVP